MLVSRNGRQAAKVASSSFLFALRSRRGRVGRKERMDRIDLSFQAAWKLHPRNPWSIPTPRFPLQGADPQRRLGFGNPTGCWTSHRMGYILARMKAIAEPAKHVLR